jgi:hypothetical protein
VGAANAKFNAHPRRDLMLDAGKTGGAPRGARLWRLRAVLCCALSFACILVLLYQRQTQAFYERLLYRATDRFLKNLPTTNDDRRRRPGAPNARATHNK